MQQQTTAAEFIEHLPRKRPLQDIDENASVVTAYELMRLHNVSVLPVYEYFSLPDIQFKEYVSFITAFDILMHWQMISSLAAEDPTKTKISQMRTYRRHCPIISGQEPAEVLLELFKAGEHWILVRIDGQSNNVQLITQFDIISQLWRERQQILPVLQTLSADNLVKIRSMPGRRDPAKPLTVLPGAHALVAMKRMLAHGVHCIAVCHEIDGKILADLSTLAVKLAPLQLITSIKEKPVLEFLEMLYQSDEEEGEIPEPLVCLPSTLLETVLLRLVENHSHHIWVVNEAETPVGVLTLTDLLAFLA